MIVKDWPLLTRAIEQIIKHPDTWKQDFWATKTDCGTAFCVAGWVVNLTGAEFDWYKPYIPELGGMRAAGVRIDGEVVSVETVANTLLGIDLDAMTPVWDDFDEHTDLYAGGNTLEDILRIVIKWAREDGYELPALITDTYNELAGVSL